MYQSAPQLLVEQPAFLNAVAEFHTEAKPREILMALQDIEHALHKNPPVRYGPRTIDLDLLLYDDLVLSEPGLTVPHPQLAERRFVLEPLCELLSGEELLHPVLKVSLQSLLQKVGDQDCMRTELRV